MAKGPDIHVVHRDGKWRVEPAGPQPTISSHRTQETAVDRARPIARRNESELVIHRRDGTIRDKDSHGHDKFPPKG